MNILRSIVFAAILATVPCAAHALDFTQSIKTINGDDFVGADGKPITLTLLSVIESSLFGEQSPNEEIKKQNYLLAVDLHNHAKDFLLTPDNIVQIRKALAATQPTAVYGQVMSAIDPTFAPKK